MTAVTASMTSQPPWPAPSKSVDSFPGFTVRAEFLLDAWDHERDRELSGNPRVAVRALPISTSSSTSSLTELDAVDRETGKYRINSGHFMSTHVHDDYKDHDAEAEGGMTDEEGECEMLGADTSSRAPLTSNPVHDADGISSLFENLTLSNRTKLTTPKWNNFKGLRLRSTIKVRLNNVLWRVWHMQFVKRKHPLIAPFSNERKMMDTRKNTDAPVLDKKYWQRRQNMVAIEYRRCRLFYRERIKGVRMPRPSPTILDFGNRTHERVQPSPFYDPMLIDYYSLPGFTTEPLFASLVNFALPQPLHAAVVPEDVSDIMDMDISDIITQWWESYAAAQEMDGLSEPAVQIGNTAVAPGGYGSVNPPGWPYQPGSDINMGQPLVIQNGYRPVTSSGPAAVPDLSGNVPVSTENLGRSTGSPTDNCHGFAPLQETSPGFSVDICECIPETSDWDGVLTCPPPGVSGKTRLGDRPLSISSDSSATAPVDPVKEKGVKKPPTMQNIYKLMGELRKLVPRPHPTKRFSQRALLNGTIQHFKRLEQEIKDLRAESDAFKLQIEGLDHTKNVYKRQPLSGIPVGDHVRKERMRAMLDEHIKKRAEKNYKYWMTAEQTYLPQFGLTIRPLLDSYTSSVRGGTLDGMSHEVTRWADEQCTLADLRPLFWDSLRAINSNTSIRTDPSRMPDEVYEALQMPVASGSPGSFIPPSLNSGYSNTAYSKLS